MEFKPSRASLKRPGPTESETAALRGVQRGTVIHPLLCKRLKALGLIEQIRGGWILTQQGQISLMFDGAR
jgi:hypothetical protein